MIDSSALLTDLKVQLRVLQADLRSRADDPGAAWGATLQREHAEALRRARTGLSWSVWRDNEVDQAAVAWVLATTFVRFCEDNDLLMGAVIDGVPVPVSWIAGPGDRVLRARENQTAYFRVNTSHHDRDWLQQAFRVLAAQPAGAALVDPRHNPVWTAEISAEAAKGLIDFWRRTDGDGALVHDFTDPDLDTRFLGDLYQDLSDHAKKTYALLQTPVFVEEFILDRTLTPAIAEFGVDGLKVIDPTCGSGHFLLGAFERLNRQWAAEAPGMDPRQRVRKAMDSIHGVDLNPFAVAIARFRLTVAGILAAGEKSLVGLEEWGFHLAIGDSLLGEQGVTNALFGEDPYTYSTEDLGEYTDILKPGQYHVVVGNPPYITVQDPAANAAYRAAYRTAHRQYQLTVPFMELFFRLAILGEQGVGAGYAGQITSNGFMKRDFGRKLIEELFGGFYNGMPIDLLDVVNTEGAYIPGHGTPTVIIIGRRRRPVHASVRTVLSVRGEPGQPKEPARGLVWSEILEHIEEPGYDGTYVSIADVDRSVFSLYPWSLSGGGAETLMKILNSEPRRLTELQAVIGRTTHTGLDEAFYRPDGFGKRRSISENVPVILGTEVRDLVITGETETLFPYDTRGEPVEPSEEFLAHVWPLRSVLRRRIDFGQTPEERGLRWYDHSMFFPSRYRTPLGIAFAFVATHNHFVLDRGGKVFKQSAPVIKLPEGATEEQHLELLGVLNSSVASFWLKEVSHNKGEGGGARVKAGYAAMGSEPWKNTYEFTGTKLQEFPLPTDLPGPRGGMLDGLARELDLTSPRAVISTWKEGSLVQILAQAENRWGELRNRLVFEQEELDWETYRDFGLIDDDLTYMGSGIGEIVRGQRAFEIRLARRVSEGNEESTWFERFGIRMATEIPTDWPVDYKSLVEQRLALMESDRSIRLLEQCEFKRSWGRAEWAELRDEALRDAILDRLENTQLWLDPQGPTTRSVAQLADVLRNDAVLLEMVRVLTRTSEPDVAAVIGSVALTNAVPYLAAYRYKLSGLEKFREWQAVWELQRREDSGEKVSIPVPPRYSPPDFQKVEYWKARGKLDVPKERFVLYPGIGREGDTSPVLGWAGWSHRDQAVALVREIMNQQALGAADEALVPMIAGLVELEPWLHQWHTELEPEFGSSAAQAVTSQTDQLLAQLQMTRDDVNAWRSPAARGGRRST